MKEKELYTEPVKIRKNYHDFLKHLSSWTGDDVEAFVDDAVRGHIQLLIGEIERLSTGKAEKLLKECGIDRAELGELRV
jgi:hypothetical protein